MVAYRSRFGYFPIYFELLYHSRLNHFHRAFVCLVNEDVVDGLVGLVGYAPRTRANYFK